MGRMPKSPWSKAVLKELIDREMTTSDLAVAIDRNPVFTSAVVHQRQRSLNTEKLINDYLAINAEAFK